MLGGGGFRYHLGGGRVPEAKRVGKIMLVASSILGTCPSTAHTAQPCALPSEVVTRGACPTSGLLGSVMFFVMGSNVGRMFSSDAEVVALSGKLAFLEGLVYMGACWDRTLLPAFPHGVGSHVCICYACATALCFFYTSIAILGGQGRPTFVAAAFVIGGWGVSVPMAWVLGFPAGLVRARVLYSTVSPNLRIPPALTRCARWGPIATLPGAARRLVWPRDWVRRTWSGLATLRVHWTVWVWRRRWGNVLTSSVTVLVQVHCSDRYRRRRCAQE